MERSVAVVMDPIRDVNPKKDTTLALIEAAQRRGWSVHYLELGDLFIRDGVVRAHTRALRVDAAARPWYEFTSEVRTERLGDFDVVLMRKDPPFDIEYVVATYMLEHAKADGALVVNDPRALRDANEKFFVNWFSEWAPPTLVTRSAVEIAAFFEEHGDIILKPLDGMGGESVFRVKEGDGNLAVIIETLTARGRRYAVAQRFIPEIVDGDRRIIVIDGEPMDHTLARIPGKGEVRGNLAAGGRGEVRPLRARERAICEAVGPVLVERGLVFVGLDVIGDYLTEINVTSPTCVREIEAGSDTRIADRFIDAVAARLEHAR